MANMANVLGLIFANMHEQSVADLTKKRTLASVPFGGRYRMIDFPLSNMVNSDIDNVGIITKDNYLSLMDHLGSGDEWDLSRKTGGMHLLPPYGNSSALYRGRLEAMAQVKPFIESSNAEYVLLSDADVVANIDYRPIIDFHEKNNADCTIAVLEVPWEEASRFGILATDENNKIYEFAEKPAEPKSNKASMGVYVFSWDKLRKYLIEDESNPDSANDFGKNIIPMMLEAGERMFAFPFAGYWKDVGTIDSLWEANLDIINPNVDLDLSDPSWKIYSKTPASPPHYIGKNAKVENSSVSEGCEIDGEVDYSVVSSNVTIEADADVRYSVIMPGAVIKKGAKVYYSIIAENAVIEENAKIGEIPELLNKPEDWGIAVIGAGATIKSGTHIEPGRMINSNEEVSE